jgi:nitroreductase
MERRLENSPLMKLILARRSVRKYADTPVPRGIIMECIEAARHAPSAHNTQPCRYVVLTERRRIEKFCDSAFRGVYGFNDWVRRAPAVIVITAKLDFVANRLGAFIQGTPYYLLDGAVAGEHIVLRAQELGLGTCWLGWYGEKQVKKLLGVPRSYRVVACISMGYPAEPPAQEKKRLDMDEIAFFNMFGGHGV